MFSYPACAAVSDTVCCNTDLKIGNSLTASVITRKHSAIQPKKDGKRHEIEMRFTHVQRRKQGQKRGNRLDSLPAPNRAHPGNNLAVEEFFPKYRAEHQAVPSDITIKREKE